MLTPLQITFRHMDPSDALRAHIESEAAKLEDLHHRITHCHVIVEQPHLHHRQGRPFRVHVDLAVPGRAISAGRAPAHASHEDAHLAVAEAFDAARRQLVGHQQAQGRRGRRSR